MRAIRKIEEHFIEQTPLDLCLDCWVRWLDYDELKIGWRDKSLGLVGNSSRSSEQLYSALEIEVGMAVDAMIDSLKTHHAWAIRKRCSVATLWRFPQMDFFSVLVEAEKELEKKLKNNIATRSYFY
jgi:hypothetical protein